MKKPFPSTFKIFSFTIFCDWTTPLTRRMFTEKQKKKIHHILHFAQNLKKIKNNETI